MNEDLIRLQMVVDLDNALHANTWARNMTPQEVWQELLEEVRELKRNQRHD